ncbi:hypothetical protein E2562_007027 [Oryza meyeriana var. granulata]|uniref:Secreted protein n=1 Tax=Oryza meyeriana var. granulata TaxID=110450 RepID=A0A6G1E9Q9_9ORYZ|nr:hypothetical protein E2562_007027 [Oryza meyeriana var. granulata]
MVGVREWIWSAMVPALLVADGLATASPTPPHRARQIRPRDGRDWQGVAVARIEVARASGARGEAEAISSTTHHSDLRSRLAWGYVFPAEGPHLPAEPLLRSLFGPFSYRAGQDHSGHAQCTVALGVVS